MLEKRWGSRSNIMLAILIWTSFCLKIEPGVAQKKNAGTLWTNQFDLKGCYFLSTGKTKYLILVPGYQLVLEGREKNKPVKVVITVLKETVRIGEVETRVVEERESVNGELTEVSRNFFAICTRTNSVFYFGEDVDKYKGGKVVSHRGAWRAGSGKARPGLMMPGIALLGARYYQEIAPGIAMDRAEIVSRNETLQTPAGTFENCLKVEESSDLEPNSKEYKLYAPEVGLIKDEELTLTRYGFVEK